MENNIIQHQLFQSGQYKTQPKLCVVQGTQPGFFYSQWREMNTLKSAIHPLLWKISTIGDSAFGVTFVSRHLKVSTEFLIFEDLKSSKRNPTQIYHKQVLLQFWTKYLWGKLDENGKLFCILLLIWKSSVYFKKKIFWTAFFG